MVKSTHRPIRGPQPSPLPTPWTEHKAPTGHAYYYNPDTKQSTYIRPTVSPSTLPPPTPLHYDPSAPNGWSGQPNFDFAARFGALPSYSGHGQHSLANQRRSPQDRPKTKHPIPGHASWIVVKTRLGRRFVHNLDTEESVWKVPEELVQGLVEFDIQEREARERKERRKLEPAFENVLGGADVLAQGRESEGAGDEAAKGGEDDGGGSDEYEEAELTDSEYESEGHASKRQRMTAPKPAEDDGDEEQYMIDEEDEEAPLTEQAMGELGEDDMVAQLAEMGQSYDLDPTEYFAEADYQDGDETGKGAEPHELTEAETHASFKDLLEDAGVNPYSTWNNILDSHSDALISDERYTLLANMRSRRDVFATWSSEKIAALKEAKENQIKLNPRIPYLRFLENNANPKLFWVEFKRKFKKEPEMKEQRALSDKEREKLYRDFISRVTKMSEEQRKGELKDLMKSIPPSTSWNRRCSVDGILPDLILADVRYATVKATVRSALIASFVETLPPVGDVAETTEEEKRRNEERDQRNEAIRRRTEQVEARKQTQEKELHSGQHRLRAEEIELERASKVGRSGLREHLER